MGALTEYVFSHAVALTQSGRLKSNIFVHERNVYILNSDHTILINFTLPDREPTFENPIGFAANDYDSDNFEEVNGQIIFTQTAHGLTRRKICSSVDGTFEDTEKTFEKFWKTMLSAMVEIQFNKDQLSTLEDNLSHIEFKAEDGQWMLTQRDIYAGTRIEVEPEVGQDTILSVTGEIKDFGPIGIRTNDFMALFQFNDLVYFYFFPDTAGKYCLFSGENYEMQGVLAGCVYDEMGIIETIKETKHGRKKPQNRTSKPKADSTTGKGKRRRRT